MKASLKFFLAFVMLALAGSVTVARAQDENAPPAKKKGGGMMTADSMTARVDAAVTLTDEQKPKVKDIYTKAFADVGDDRSKMREVMTKANADVRALLTPDQQTKFDAMPAAGGRGGKKKGGN